MIAKGASYVECCIACDDPIEDGDQVYPDVSGGYLHAGCCGPDGFVNLDTGDPLPPDEVPEAETWGRG